MLTLEGEVVADVLPQPRRLSFGQVSKRSEAIRELTLRVPEPDQIEITSVTVDDERFQIERQPDDAKGNATYQVRFVGSDELGRISGRVRVEFTGSDVSHIEVPLWGEIVGDLRYPKRLSFYRQRGAYKPRKVTFSSRTKQPVELRKVEDLGGHLEIEVVAKKGELAELDVAVAKSARKASEVLKGTLRVETTDRDEPEVKIEYGIYPADRIRSMKDRIRKPRPGPKAVPTASAR